MTASPIRHCPPDCELAGTDRHHVETTPSGVTVIHHERVFAPITVHLDETLGQSSYTIRLDVETNALNAHHDPAIALTQLATAALRAGTYLAQLHSTPRP